MKAVRLLPSPIGPISLAQPNRPSRATMTPSLLCSLSKDSAVPIATLRSASSVLLSSRTAPAATRLSFLSVILHHRASLNPHSPGTVPAV